MKEIQGSHLRSGSTLSCGCYRKESNTTHGMTDTKEYELYIRIQDRCYNENHEAYRNYGGRGIAVCDRWKDSFENFYEDMGDKPGEDYSLDRIDNNKGYSPDNCKWATRKEQNRNRRGNKIQSIEQANEIRRLYKTEKYTQIELGKMYNCSKYVISKIINNQTWT